MKKLFLFLIISVCSFAAETINVANEDFGSLTKYDTNLVEVKLPTETNVQEIVLRFNPNKGKIVVLSKEGKNKKEIASVVLNGTEEETTFKLQKIFLKDVEVIFIPENINAPLKLKSYAFNVFDQRTIQLYTSIQKSQSSSTAAGASAETIVPFSIPQTVPANLPTEYTISRASL
jgi:hypothetical protein